MAGKVGNPYHDAKGLFTSADLNFSAARAHKEASEQYTIETQKAFDATNKAVSPKDRKKSAAFKLAEAAMRQRDRKIINVLHTRAAEEHNKIGKSLRERALALETPTEKAARINRVNAANAAFAWYTGMIPGRKK